MHDCPIDDYDQMTVGEVEAAVDPYTNGLEQLSDSDLAGRLDLVTAVLEYERTHKDRKTAKGSIEDVVDALEAEARPRGLLGDQDQDHDTDTDAESTTDTDSSPDTSDTTDDAPDDVADGGDDAEDVAPDDSAGTPPAEAEGDAVAGADADADQQGPMAQNEAEARELGFNGTDGRDRALVRNPQKASARIAGHGFDAGEVKDIVVDDTVRAAIRRGRLQVVKG